MKKSFLKSVAVILVASFIASGAFAASKKAKKEKKVKAKTILVGTGSSSPLYCYLDDNGELAGFEIDVIKAIDELLPQYEFKFEIFDFKNILLALAAGKIDIGAHMYESNPERRKNYLFTDYGYNDFSKYIVVLKENTNVKSLKDLVGKTAQAATGSATGAILQHWNEEHPNEKINAVLTSTLTNEQVVAAIQMCHHRLVVHVEAADLVVAASQSQQPGVVVHVQRLQLVAVGIDDGQLRVVFQVE